MKKTRGTQTVSSTPAGRRALVEAKAAEARRNPLIRAVEIDEERLANYDTLMVAAVGNAALDDNEFFDELHAAMTDLIFETSVEAEGLSPRKRTAFLHQRWKAFAREWAAKARQRAALKATA
jgi:hypothetical protein